MWLMTPVGFVSVVAHRTKPRHLLIRCRCKEDLLNLRPYVGRFDLQYDEYADYPWRAVVRRKAWERALTKLARDIDYPNFKNEVAKRQGYERSALYSRVWTVLLELQEYRDGMERSVFGMWAGRGPARPDTSPWPDDSLIDERWDDFEWEFVKERER